MLKTDMYCVTLKNSTQRINKWLHQNQQQQKTTKYANMKNIIFMLECTGKKLNSE